jgi:hypothetical protein
MINSAKFKKRVLDMIEECSSNFFIVKQDFNIQCTCLDHSTKQPNPACKKCLGTGYKVTIKKMRGACREELKGGNKLSAETSRITRTYYIDSKYSVDENNYIIDHNEVYYIYRAAAMRGLDGVITHKQVTTVLKSEDHEKVLRNFMELINKKLTAEQKGEFPWLI